MAAVGRRPSVIIALAVLASGATSSACSTHATAPTEHTQLPPPAPTATLAFDDASTLTLTAGETQPVTVTVAPPGQYLIGFALIGDPADGSLGSDDVITDAEGRAEVTLHAPSVATTFDLRASLLAPNGTPTGVTADRQVAVSDQGFGTVTVAPTYLGQRTITTWSASVTQTTCAALEAQGLLPGDPPGGLSATAPFGGMPQIANVPVGPSVAVSVRAGHFAWGCTDTQAVTVNGDVTVMVPVIDEPIDLADAGLTATFVYTPDPSSYATLVGGGVTTLVDAFVPAGSSEGTLVLDEMATVTTDAAGFASARVSQGWDALADAHFAALPQSLRTTCGDWATAGLALQPTSVQASLAGAQGDALTVDVLQLGNLDAPTAGLTAAPGASWSGEAGDGVLLSAVLVLEPSRFAGASALAPAEAAFPAATTVSGAMSLAADCHGLAAALGAFDTCTTDCVESLCDAAIAARWQSALAASANASAPGKLVIQGSASATVGDLAQPVTLTGQWDGTMTIGSGSLALKNGTLTASAYLSAP